MSAVPWPTRNAAVRTRLLLCLLLLAVGFRAAIPVGYMPDPHSLRQGMVRITLCTALGGVSGIRLSLDDGRQTGAHAGMHADRHTDQHAGRHTDEPSDKHDAGHDHAGGAECPFWAAAHLALNLPPGPLVPLAVVMADTALPAASTATTPTQALAGPPLGSRAPPRLAA
jgi:hypothetical protein